MNIRRFVVSLIFSASLLFSPGAVPVVNAASGSVESNLVTASLESGFRLYDKQMGIYMYTQAFKIKNNNPDKYVSGCKLYYSLMRSDGSVALSTNRSTETVPPMGYIYSALWLAQDSQVGPTGQWSIVRFDKLECSPSSNSYLQYSFGAPLTYQMGPETINGDWVYSEIVITNPGKELVTAIANVAILSSNYSVIGRSALSGADGCYAISLVGGKSITCKINRELTAPFGSYQINWIRSGYAAKSFASDTQSSTSNGGKQVCVSSRSFNEICYEGSEWTYEICSSSAAGVVQQKIASTWKTLWKFTGQKDSSSCPAKSNPYLISIEGISSQSSGKFNLRLQFPKTKQKLSWTSDFVVEIVNV
jgi:hypothetical protein